MAKKVGIFKHRGLYNGYIKDVLVMIIIPSHLLVYQLIIFF